MKNSLNKEDLIKFEEDIANCFNNKMIKAPVHLTCNNEDQLISIFKEIREEDFIFTTWRSHLHILLKGCPPEKLKKAILEGKSITLCFPEYNVFSSAIVGGIIPIALGTALSLKRDGKGAKVFCFIGDMTSTTGSFSECLRYAENHNLPITYIIENNGKSVCTDSYKIWNTNKLAFEPKEKSKETIKISDHLWYYWYELDRWQHAGTNIRVQF